MTTYYEAVWCEDYFEEYMDEDTELTNDFFMDFFKVKKRWICPNVTSELTVGDFFGGLEVIVVECEHAEPGYAVYAEGV